MKHLYIRPESKVKDKLGRGATVVLYDEQHLAVVSLLESLRTTHGYTSDMFGIDFEDPKNIKILTYNDHDYYRWLDVIAKPVYYITVEQDDVIEGADVAGIEGAKRYSREPLEVIGYNEEIAELCALYSIEVLNNKTVPVPEEPHVPLTEIAGYGNEYDLPIAGSFKSTSLMGRFFKFLSDLTTRPEEDSNVGKTRKPFVVFESYLGGNIAIYKSLTTDREVDVAFFDRYGQLVNVFSFQDGCPHVHGINGLTIEDLISISTWRILHLNNNIHADENIEAVHHLNTAIDVLDARTRKRAEALLDQEQQESA